MFFVSNLSNTKPNNNYVIFSNLKKILTSDYNS